MILHDFKCAKHGLFERSHPICPHLGCDSSEVTKVFLRAPGTVSSATRRFDAGIRNSAERMGISNFRSARAGEAAYGGQAGKGLLWGDDVAKAFPGMNFAQLQQRAAAGATMRLRNGETVTIPDGMRQAAASGITERVLPVAERTVHSADSGPPGAT
jgi:hypothetical protein